MSLRQFAQERTVEANHVSWLYIALSRVHTHTHTITHTQTTCRNPCTSLRASLSRWARMIDVTQYRHVLAAAPRNAKRTQTTGWLSPYLSTLFDPYMAGFAKAGTMIWSALIVLANAVGPGSTSVYNTYNPPRKREGPWPIRCLRSFRFFSFFQGSGRLTAVVFSRAKCTLRRPWINWPCITVHRDCKISPDFARHCECCWECQSCTDRRRPHLGFSDAEWLATDRFASWKVQR